MDRLLTGSRVRLMAFMPDDLPVLVRWYQDTEFLRLYDAEAAYPRTPKQLGEYIDEQQKSAKAFIFAIRLLDRDEMIGYAELDGINWAQRAGWISLAIGDSAQRGRGHGTEAMRLLAIELGVPAQGLILDHCGCSWHWDPGKGIVTEINFRKLREILGEDLASND